MQHVNTTGWKAEGSFESIRKKVYSSEEKKKSALAVMEAGNIKSWAPGQGTTFCYA